MKPQVTNVLIILGGLLLIGLSSLFVLSKRGSRRRKATPFIRAVEGSKFPIKELEQRLRNVLPTFLNTPPISLYKRSSDTVKSQRRGKEFEKKAAEVLEEFLSKNRYSRLTWKKEVVLGRESRVDFLLEWRISSSLSFKVLMECKHSVKMKGRRNQIHNGREQLKRYEGCCPTSNLSLLLLDFPLPRRGSFEGIYDSRVLRLEAFSGILMLNLALLSPLLKEIDLFIHERYPRRGTPAPYKGPKPQKNQRPRTRETALFLKLSSFFEERLKDRPLDSFEISPEDLLEALGVDRTKYNRGGVFSLSLWKYSFLRKNLPHLKKRKGIDVLFRERSEGDQEVWFFYVERLAPKKHKKRHKKPQE